MTTMTPWISPTIPYSVTPLDRGSGMVPTMADGNLTQAGVTRYQKHIQHLLDYTYMKSPLISKGGASIETMAEQTYHQSSLGKRPMGEKIVKYTYHTPPVGNLSRTTRIIQSAGFGPH